MLTYDAHKEWRKCLVHCKAEAATHAAVRIFMDLRHALAEKIYHLMSFYVYRALRHVCDSEQMWRCAPVDRLVKFDPMPLGIADDEQHNVLFELRGGFVVYVEKLPSAK